MSSTITEYGVEYENSSMLIAKWKGETYEAFKFQANFNAPWQTACMSCDLYPPEGLDGISEACLMIRCSESSANVWPDHPMGRVYWKLVEHTDD